MATETTERRGYFSGWTLKKEGIIAPDERLPWGQTIFVGLQHVLAMFGATVLAPIIMGFNPNTAIFFSGIGTLIFFLVVGGRVPSYLGSSFSFIAVVLVAEGATHNIPAALGGIITAGVVYAIIGIVVIFVGYKWIEYLMPPVVTGTVVAVIGLNLATTAISEANHSRLLRSVKQIIAHLTPGWHSSLYWLLHWWQSFFLGRCAASQSYLVGLLAI